MIIALEGPCYSGKTTTCKKLHEIKKENITVEEYSKLINPNKFPNHKSCDEKSIFFFIELEEKRQETIKKILNQGLSPILDRSFMSCIAFDYALCKMGLKNKNFWEKTKKIFLAQNFILPDVLFFLDVSCSEIKKRVKKHPCFMPSFFTSTKFNQNFKNFIVSQQNIIPVKIINANPNPEAVMHQVLSNM